MYCMGPATASDTEFPSVACGGILNINISMPDLIDVNQLL